MMQSAEQRKLGHISHLGRLDGARFWRILVERQMRAGAVVIVGYAGAEHPSQVTLVHHDDVVQQLSPKCPDDTSKITVGTMKKSIETKSGM